MLEGDARGRAFGQDLTHRIEQTGCIHAAVATQADPLGEIPQLNDGPVAEIGEAAAAHICTGSGHPIHCVSVLMIT